MVHTVMWVQTMYCMFIKLRNIITVFVFLFGLCIYHMEMHRWKAHVIFDTIQFNYVGKALHFIDSNSARTKWDEKVYRSSFPMIFLFVGSPLSCLLAKCPWNLLQHFSIT